MVLQRALSHAGVRSLLPFVFGTMYVTTAGAQSQVSFWYHHSNFG